MTGLRTGELFAGVGGLGMAVDEVFDAEPAWFAEFDTAPSKVLAYRYPGVPNHGDVTKVDWANVEPVDILCGGFPCQDVSLAGRRRGMRDGTRSGLWSEFARAIDIIRPEWVVIENVRGLLSADAAGSVEPCPWCLGDDGEQHALRALGAVLGDLAELGFDAEWTGLRAADIGAPHGRFRVFILAWPATNTESMGGGRGRRDLAGTERTHESGSQRDAKRGAVGHRSAIAPVALLPTPIVSDGTGGPKNNDGALFSPQLREITQLLPTPRTTDMNGPGTHGLGGPDLRTTVSLLPTPTATMMNDGESPESWQARADRIIAANPGRGGMGVPLTIRSQMLGDDTDWGPYAAAVARWETVIGRDAPSPVRHDGKGGKPRLNPELPEWMMGWPEGWVTDPAIGLTRAEQLKACGNGVVPQQAAHALRQLLARPGVPSIRSAVSS